MNGKTYFEYTLTHQNTRDLTLSIRLNSDGFLFFVQEPNGRIIGFQKIDFFENKSYENQVKEHLLSNENLNFDYREVKLCYHSDAYTLIPNDFFNPDFLNDYWKINYSSIPDTDTILKHWPVKNINSQVVAQVKTELENFILSHFNTVAISHFADSLISFSLKEYELRKVENIVCIHCLKKTADIILIQNGQLKLINNYDYFNTEELIYFASNILKQHSIDSGNVCLITEFLNEEPKDMRLFNKYFQCIEAPLQKINTAPALEQNLQKNFSSILLQDAYN